MQSLVIRRVWNEYAERSIVGSGVYSTIEACKGNHERARCLGQGMGRATAGILVISRNIPILHEIAVASDSLGDCIAGEPGKAVEHWKQYVENSVIGSCGAALNASIRSNEAEASRLLVNCGKTLLKAGMEGVVLTATVVTAGAAAPAGLFVAASSTAVASSATTTASFICSAALDGKLNEMTVGDIIGTSLAAAASGAAAGVLAVKQFQATEAATGRGVAATVEPVVEPLLSEYPSVDKLPSGFAEPPNPRLWNNGQPMYENSPFTNYKHTPDFTAPAQPVLPTVPGNINANTLHMNASICSNPNANLSVAGKSAHQHMNRRSSTTNPNHAENLLGGKAKPRGNAAMNAFAEGRLRELIESRDSAYVTRHHARYGNVIELKNADMMIGFRWHENGTPIGWINVLNTDAP